MIVKQQIFGFQVAVDNAHVMDSFQPTDDLVKKSASLGFFDTALRNDIIEKFPSASILHNEVELPAGFDNFIKLHDV